MIVLEPAAGMLVIVMLMAASVLMLVNIVAVQEFRLEIEDAVEIERIALQDLREFYRATLGTMQLGIGIDAADARLQLAQRRRSDKIDLVEQDDVGKGNLILGLRRVGKPLAEPFGIGNGHYGIELGLASDIVVKKKRLCHRGRISQAGGFDDNRVERPLA